MIEMQAMNLRQLRAVQTVAELGSVTAAADRLGLTQSAVSRMIAGLEAELGVGLFERFRRRLVLSKHALPFIARAERIISEMHELEASARAIRQGLRDRMRIIAVPPFLQKVVPAAVASRLKSNPQLSVRLEIARRVDIPDWINRRDFDIAIVGLPVDRPEVTVEPLPPVEAVAVLPRGHRLAKQKRVALEHLCDGPLVAHAAGPLMRLELDRALAHQGLQATPVVEAPSAWLVCSLVAAGAGLAVVDPFTAIAQVDSGLVVRPLTKRVVLKYGIVTLRERPLVGEAAVLAQGIKDEVNRTIKEVRKA
jgi:DNA-binding transcriptional LysR family regulator